jgi:lysophospholipase L1-like esterase
MVCAAALVVSCQSSRTPTQPSPPPGPGSAVNYTAVGASDAVGVGASVVCVPLTECPDGTGYVPVIARQLRDVGATVNLVNLGLPAAVLSPVVQTLGRQYGRTIPGNFLQNLMPFVPRNSTLVTVFAGGNDTNAIADAFRHGAGGNNPEDFIESRISALVSDFERLVKGIRDRATTARIVAANLPNFAGLPFTAGFTPDERRIMERISVGFSVRGVNMMASQGIVVVDLLCDPRSYQPGNYSADGFHPNDAGYAVMASEMLRAIRSDSFPLPAANCPQMTLAR